MYKKFYLTLIIGLVSYMVSGPAMANSLVSFDFDGLSSKAYRSKDYTSVESYMETIYGEDISVSKGTAAFKGNFAPLTNFFVSNIGQPSSPGMYLRNSANKPIILDFGTNGISSFSVDWKLFKNGKGLTILADGIIVDQQTLLKSQKKSGAGGNLTLYFDDAVHQLQFVGLKNTRFGLDNLLINLPEPDAGGLENSSLTEEFNDSNEGQGDPGERINPLENIVPLVDTTASVPEPASLVLLALGLCAAWWSRRYAVGS